MVLPHRSGTSYLYSLLWPGLLVHHFGSRAAMAALCLFNLVTLGPQVLLLERSILCAPHIRCVTVLSHADMLPASCHALCRCGPALRMPLEHNMASAARTT